MKPLLRLPFITWDKKIQEGSVWRAILTQLLRTPGSGGLLAAQKTEGSKNNSNLKEISYPNVTILRIRQFLFLVGLHSLVSRLDQGQLVFLVPVFNL